MAKIIFNPNSPIQRLSGRYGNSLFVFKNGKQFLHGAKHPVLPKNPTSEQRRLFRRLTLIEQCVNILQTQIELSQQAIDARKIINDRITYLYDKYSSTIAAPTKLQKKIMTEYYTLHPLTEFGVPLNSFRHDTEGKSLF